MPPAPSTASARANASASATACGSWRPRSLYASVFLWISVVGGRFLVVFLEHEAGLTSAQLGTILAVAQLLSVAASALAGSWADALEFRFPGAGRALVLAGGMVLGGAVFLLHGVDLTTTVPVLALPPVLWHGFLRVTFGLATAMVFPVMDGMCLDFLQHHASPQDYGKERMYGAVSWGFANVLVAGSLDYFEGFASLYVMAVAATLIGVAVVFLYARQQSCQLVAARAAAYRKKNSNTILEYDDEGNEDEQMRTNEDKGTAVPNDDDDTEATAPAPAISTFQMLYLLGASWFGFCFIVAQITQSSGQAIVDTLVFLYFEALGSSYSLMGWTVVLTVAFEIPLFHIASPLLQRWGPGPLIPIAAASYVVRVWGYSLIPEGRVVHVLWLEPLHGVTFACMNLAGVDLISSLVSSPGYEASGQSALQVLVGTGSVLGLLLGGLLEELLGPRCMYRISGLVVLVGCTLFATALYYCPPCKNHQASRIINQADEELSSTVPCTNSSRSFQITWKTEEESDTKTVEMARLVLGQGRET